MQKVSRFYPPDREVLKDISLSFFPGAKIGVLGNNGSGKSSLLSIMAGQDPDHDGDARLTDGFTVGLLEQEPVLNPEKNVLENVMEGVGEVASLLSRYDDILASWSNPDADFEKLGEQQAEVERLIESAGAWDLQRNIEIAMDALRLPKGESDVNLLSGGECRRVALCKLLLSKPDLLLLDEPTNHLDAESVSWLERTLQDYSGTVVAVTHDRYFLDNVAGWILELDRGRGIPYEGNYSGWLDQKSTRLEAEEKSDSSRKRTLERELEWIRMAPKARQAKGKARLASYDKLIAEANEAEKRDAELQIQIPANSRLGDQVIEVENLKKGFEDRLLIEDLSFNLPPAGIVGIVGGNGAGKTTLFRMLVAAFQNLESDDDLPDSGSIRIGSTVELGYVDQSRDSLDPDRTVYQEITGDKEFISVGNREVNGRAYVASFNFRGSDQQKKVGDLSGGERNRVHLAKVLKAGSNVLLLDEPTNDLDVDTLRALESGLEAFPGCAVIISHDRWFLDRVATHVLAFEGNSYVRWFEGNFSEYEEVKRRESGGENVPTRVQYKPLSRD
jgi:sulfate-transporting ATPase